jgi:multisubunit Na+/H+ antiporter MnhC subunit
MHEIQFRLLTPLFFIDFKNFGILLLGRLLGGVATSLLFSIFEAWLIRSHADAQIKHLLGKSFSWAAFSNSIVAILTGLVANKLAEQFELTPIQEDFLYIGGYLSPFDLAMVTSLLCALAAGLVWEENYGESEAGSSGHEDSSKVGGTPQWYDGLVSAYRATVRSQDVLLCGIISSLFEGSMYIFVFMWTPALSGEEELPFGLIFSTFMVCCMGGSSVYAIFSDSIKGEKLAVAVFAIAAVAMAFVVMFEGKTMKFIGMNIFECTVGMYFPIMGTLKGAIVPESMRAGIYNLYRIPLNFIVLFSLLTDLTPTMSFSLNCVMLSTATGLQYILMKRRENYGLTESESANESESRTGLLTAKADVEAV